MSEALAPTHWRPPSVFNLTAIALLLTLIGLGAAYLLVAAAKNPQITKPSVWSEPLIRKNVAGTKLTIPASWLGASWGENGDFSDQVNLEVNLQFSSQERFQDKWPRLSVSKTRPNKDLSEGFGSNKTEMARTRPHPVKLRLLALSKAQPSSYLLNTVYMRQFSPLQKNDVSGLVGKPLKPEEGFENETVWYDPLSPNPFVAKCLGGNINPAKASCLRTVQLTSRLAVIYSFDADLLVNWKNFDATTKPILTQIGVFSTP